MLIGMMNDPRQPIEQEVEYAAQHDFDFLDLTLEPPLATGEAARSNRVRAAVAKSGLKIVGHTAYYLPVDSAYPRLQRAALEQIADDLKTLADLGAEKVSLHLIFSNPDKMTPTERREQLWRAALDYLLPLCERIHILLMLENTETNPERIQILENLLRSYPSLAFHLDVGHAALGFWGDQLDLLLSKFGSRLRHVHLSDNVGGEKDLHLPLFCGTIDWKRVAEKLRATGYDDTFTLEVFARRREYLILSKDIWKQIWQASGSGTKGP